MQYINHKAKYMGEICHNCKSEFTFFDGEVYQCLNCSYMWIPENKPKESYRQHIDKVQIKKEIKTKDSKDRKLF